MKHNEKCASWGRVAVRVGDRDGNYANGDLHTGYVDALANIMHAARADEVDFFSALDSATEHYEAEIAEVEC